MKEFFKQRLIEPLLGLLRQGLTPEKLALCVALGITLGTFPVLGSTTLLCTGAAFLFRLNLPAIQLINYFMYPVQLMLFIPFLRAGEFLFNERPADLSLDVIFTGLSTDLAGTVGALWWTNVHGMAVWLLTAPLIGVIVYAALSRIFATVQRKMAENEAA